MAAGIGLVGLTLAAGTACHAAPPPASSPEAPSTAIDPEATRPVSLALLAQPYAGLPVRAFIAVSPAAAGTRVAVQRSTGSGWSQVAAGATGVGGRAFLTWTWPTSGSRTLRAVVVGASGVTATSPSLTASVLQPTTSAWPTTKSVTARLVSADGQRQWIDCQGTGGPTTVLISGNNGWSKDWARVLPQLRAGGRVCTYDRAGLGRSLPRTGPTRIHSGVHARELLALLQAAGEQGPFLVVAHSYGGFIGRSLANRRPRAVAGLVLVDAVPPGIQNVYDGYGHLRDEPGAIIDYDVSSDQTGYAAPLRGLPLVVLSAEDTVSWAPPWVAVKWTQMQDQIARYSPNSLRVLALGAGHQMQDTAPAVVIRGITLMRDSLRTHRPLPACDAGWAAIQSRCTSR